jgi:C4-dicarboxylate transporter DctM subunit
VEASSLQIWLSVAVVAFLFFTGTPILLCIAGWVAFASYYLVDFPLINMGIVSTEGIKSFVFLAVPLFVATGDLLTEGGISRQLVNFARSLVSWMPGSMAATATVSCGLFAAVSGSNSATAATMGRLLGPAMMERGVPRPLAAAIVAAGGTVGVVIPPSVIFLIYGVTMDVPSVDLFVGGVIPGIIMVVLLVLWAVLLTGRVDRTEGLSSFRPTEVVRSAIVAWPGFLAIGIIFFGLFWGYFSPTEAAGVVTLYCALAGFLFSRQLKLSKVPAILLQSASITGIVVPMVVFSIQLQQVGSVMGVSDAIQEFLTGFAAQHGRWFAVLLMMLIILAVGALTESVAVVLILGPIFAPVAEAIGFDPIHWGVIFVVGTTIGFVTPPYGLNLFVASAVMDVPYGQVCRSMLKLLTPLMLAWIVITLVPWTALALLHS